MDRTKAVAAALMLALVVAACGSSATPGSSTTSSAGTLTKQQAAARFKQIVAPVDTALGTVGAKLKKLSATGSATRAEMGELAAPAVSALVTLNDRIDALEKSYPRAASALQNLKTADQPLILDIKNIKKLTIAKLKSWARTFHADAEKTAAADQAVRQKLGLPKNTERG